MTYTNLHTTPTWLRFLIGILNLLTPIAIIAITNNGIHLTISLNWFCVAAIATYFFVNYIVLVKLYGGSLFQILFAVRVIQLNGNHGISWSQAIKRALAGNILSLFTFLLPYAPIFLNAERRHLGDLWAKTKVISIQPKRSTPPKVPAHIFLVLTTALGLVGSAYLVAVIFHTKIDKIGLHIKLNPSTQKTILWEADTKKQFIAHCSAISSEYLKIAMQGQNVDEKLMKQFTDSIETLCDCVANEVESSPYGAKADTNTFTTREKFEALFEQEDFTIAYVQASATCESELKNSSN